MNLVRLKLGLRTVPLVVLGLVSIIAFAVACGDSETPAPAPAPTVDVQAIIEQTLQSQPQPESMTPEDVAKAMQETMAAQPGVTEQDMARAIAEALEARPGVTQQDVASAIAGALAEQPEQPGVTQEDVARAIADALAAQTPGLTEAQVADAIANAMSDSPGITEEQIRTLVSSAVAESVPMSMPMDAMAGEVMQSGDVTFVSNLVNPMIGDPAIAPYRDWEQSGGLAITEYMFVMEDGNPMSPHLASDWNVADDGSKVTIGVKQGIPWNSPPDAMGQDFGEFTAHDVVWFMNRQNAFTNPQSTSGDAGDFAAVFGEARALDDYTLEIDLQTPTYFGLPLSQFGILGAAPSIRSKNVFDTMGEEWMRDHAVGTGPFIQVEWVNNERGVSESVPSHWNETATISTFTKLQIPENSSRVAMLKTGQADIAVLDFKLVPNLITEGLSFLSSFPGGYVGQSILYPGNLWEEIHPVHGTPLGNTVIGGQRIDYDDPWLAPPYEEDIPWIGDPWQDMGKEGLYTDDNNPEGMTDMEQARLVRLALGMAIDRDSINEVVLGGLGTPIYSEYMGPLYPGWEPDRVAPPMDWATGDVIDNPMSTEAGVPWTLQFDPDGAKALLAAAGYPDGFDVTLQSYVAETGEVTLEIADIITSQWSQIGLNVVEKREDYGSVISPRMRQRVQFDPVVKNGDVNSNQFPKDWPYPPVDSALSRPGWGVGFETPVLSSNHLEIRSSKDKAFRENLHQETVDYILYWQLYNGVYQIPKGVVVNPNRVSSWSSRPVHYGNIGTPQWIRLIGQ